MFLDRQSYIYLFAAHFDARSVAINNETSKTASCKKKKKIQINIVFSSILFLPLFFWGGEGEVKLTSILVGISACKEEKPVCIARIGNPHLIAIDNPFVTL